MKQLLFIPLISLFGSFGIFAQTTAMDFTASDCSGTSHHLFAELDAGTVVVICWPMPCAQCISPTSTAAAAVQSFASSNPGKVKFYLVDDKGDTPCSSLTSWATTNSIATDAVFDNKGEIIKMSDYGTDGMPKCVVLGGTSHTVFYNKNNVFVLNEIKTAINNAISSAGVIENDKAVKEFFVSPNPVKAIATVSYTLNKSTQPVIEIVNMLGEKINSFYLENQGVGKHMFNVDMQSLSEGTYFVNLYADGGKGTEVQHYTITVSH